MPVHKYDGHVGPSKNTFQKLLEQNEQRELLLWLKVHMGSYGYEICLQKADPLLQKDHAKALAKLWNELAWKAARRTNDKRSYQKVVEYLNECKRLDSDLAVRSARRMTEVLKKKKGLLALLKKAGY